MAEKKKRKSGSARPAASEGNYGQEMLKLLEQRGFAPRKHLPEVGWGSRKITVLDLNQAEKALLAAEGAGGLARHLEKRGQWIFPALDISRALPISRDTVLAAGRQPVAVVVSGRTAATAAAARDFVRQVKKKFGRALPLAPGDEFPWSGFLAHNVIIFGGAHENGAAAQLALRCLVGAADGVVPGRGGWLAIACPGLVSPGRNVVQAAGGGGEQLAAAAALLLDGLKETGGNLVLPHVYRVSPGEEMRRHLTPWAAHFKAMTDQRRHLAAIEHPFSRSGKGAGRFEETVRLLAASLDSGGFEKNYYNVFAFIAAIQAARYFLVTGHRPALDAFRAALEGIARYYLQAEPGASYPADVDFYAGLVVHYYRVLEHDKAFSAADRVFYPNILLAVIRSACEYYSENWEPRLKVSPTRHNHQTFPARTLRLGADYFERHGVPDAAVWRAKADAVFTEETLWSRWKQSENAATYEPLVYEHAASFSALADGNLDRFRPGILRAAARRQVVSCDNFFRPVDYGDCGLVMQRGAAEILPMLEALRSGDPEMAWFSRESFRLNHSYFSGATYALGGLRRDEPGTAPAVGVWEEAALDPAALAEFAPGMPGAGTFDKIAFRTGWGEDDHYLLFNGFGNRQVSHSHLELNAVVRLNHLGRHLLVSNGYGKPVGEKNAIKAYRAVQRGPEDHNTLVVRRGGETVTDLPVAARLLARGAAGDLLYLVSEVRGYAGVDWARALVVSAGRFVLVVDRLAFPDRVCPAGWFEWNCLGEVFSREPESLLLRQQGVYFSVAHAPDRVPQLGEMHCADWYGVLNGEKYPYADYPPRKAIFPLPEGEKNKTSWHAVLFSASRECLSDYRLKVKGPGDYLVEGPCFARGFSVRDKGLDFSCRTGRLSVSCAF